MGPACDDLREVLQARRDLPLGGPGWPDLVVAPVLLGTGAKAVAVTNHGTITGYIDKRCRCSKCRKAWNEYQKARYRKWAEIGQCRECPTIVTDGQVRCVKHRQAYNAAVKKRLAKAR